MMQRSASGPLPTADPSEQILTTGPWLYRDGDVETVTVGLLVGLTLVVLFLVRRRRRSPSAH